MRLPVFSPPLAREAMPSRPRVLWLSCVAHAMHDGYTDMIYALLPVWQSEFGLDFAALAILRGIYAGAMAALQLPAGWLAQRLGSRVTLASGTLLAALGCGRPRILTESLMTRKLLAARPEYHHSIPNALAAKVLQRRRKS